MLLLTWKTKWNQNSLFLFLLTVLGELIDLSLLITSKTKSFIYLFIYIHAYICMMWYSLECLKDNQLKCLLFMQIKGWLKKNPTQLFGFTWKWVILWKKTWSNFECMLFSNAEVESDLKEHGLQPVHKGLVKGDCVGTDNSR